MQQNTAPAQPVEFLRGPDCARLLGFSYSHLRSLMRKGEGPPSIKAGRVRIFCVNNVREWATARTQR